MQQSTNQRYPTEEPVNVMIGLNDEFDGKYQLLSKKL
jgi:hypothetical protein